MIEVYIIGYFYVANSEIGKEYCAINDAFYCMFSALCVLAINDNSCVYIHEQAMSRLHALEELTSCCIWNTQYLDNVYKTNGVFTTYHWSLYWFRIYKHALYINPQCKFCKNTSASQKTNKKPNQTKQIKTKQQKWTMKKKFQ